MTILGGQGTISGRLLSFSALFVTLAIIIASVILWLIVANVVREQIDQRLDTQIEGLRSALQANADGSVALGASLDGPPFDRLGSGWYWQVVGSGVHLTSSSLNGEKIESPPHPVDWRHLLTGMPQGGDASDISGRALYLRKIQTIAGNKPVEITATAPQAALTGPARRALLWLVPAMALLGASLAGGTWLQVRYGLRPLRQMTKNVSAISAGAISRLPDAGVEDLRPVSREINRLVDQNVERLAETRLHFANLAHGLKTPVASLALAVNTENDSDGELRTLVDRIDRRIRHHLARARTAMSGAGLASSTIISPRVDDLVSVMLRIHADRALAVVRDIDDRIAVACAAEDLDEILGNILDNAFKWAGSSVSISAQKVAKAVLITIEDDGPGIVEAAITEAFQPGARLDETVPGHGFGLTIAKEITELYGGTIALSNNPTVGLTVSVTLPAAGP